MGVILRETANTRQAVQFAALFVTINGAELSQAQRQITVGTGKGFVYLAVVRAIHGLEKELFALLRCVDGLERVLAVFGVVARGYVEVFATDMRRHNLLVTVLLLDLLEKLLQFESELCATREPQRQTGTYGR